MMLSKTDMAAAAASGGRLSVGEPLPNEKLRARNRNGAVAPDWGLAEAPLRSLRGPDGEAKRVCRGKHRRSDYALTWLSAATEGESADPRVR